jgi:hypothetical protein
MKITFVKLLSAIKGGWELPILPNHIEKLERNIFIKMFKLIGSISIFIIISKIGNKLNDSIYYFIFSISILFIFYKYIITFYIIKQWFHNLFNGNFIVKNSPIDPISTILRGSFSSLRSITNFTIGVGFTYALCHELDDILEKEGKEPYFIPQIRNIINKSGLSDYMKVFLVKLGIKDQLANKDYKSIHDIFQNLNLEERKTFEKETGINYDTWKKGFDYLENNDKTSKISNELKNFIEKEDPFGNRRK